MLYGSVCSGIEAATVAWEPLGWEAVFFSEIEAFPSAVLKHHYPDTPNLGDMTKFKEWPDASINVLVGGTPCQSFSVAGLCKGLADPRGNLMLTYGAIAGRYRPLWLVWENVPGVLSSNGGKDFGTFLGMLAELGYGFAYRVLDAQYFGVPQRRRRVFVVGYFGDWRPAAAVLFERHSLSGNSAPRREKGERIAPTVAAGPPFSRTGNERVECEAMVAGTLSSRNSAGGGLGTDMDLAGGVVCMETGQGNAGIGIGIGTTLNCNHEAPIVAFAENSRAEVRLEGGDGDRTGALSSGGGKPGQGIPMIVQARERDCVCRMREGKDGGGKGPLISDDVSLTLATGNDQTMQYGSTVRRLTPREAERLQGFPDNFTLIPWRGKPAEQCSDGPRYKALGNSMAVPVMRWLGQRIELVNRMLREGK